MEKKICSREIIYLIHEREFINSKQNIYKIGKTKRPIQQRVSSYPKGSELLFCMYTNNCDLLEKYLINLFIEKFKQRTDFGKERFEGDLNHMIKIIFQNIDNYNNNILQIPLNSFTNQNTDNNNENIQKENNKKVKSKKENNKKEIKETNIQNVIPSNKLNIQIADTKINMDLINIIYIDNKKKYECVCKKIYKRLDYLKNHIFGNLGCHDYDIKNIEYQTKNEEHAENIIKSYQRYNCEYCNKKFSSHSNTIRHRKICKKNYKNFNNIIQNQNQNQNIENTQNNTQNNNDKIKEMQKQMKTILSDIESLL